MSLRENTYASLDGLSSSDVAYAQQAATHADITVDGITVRAKLDPKGKKLEVINVEFSIKDYQFLKSKLAKTSQTLPVCFILKHSYFRSLHNSLARISPNTICRLFPKRLKPDQRKLPRTPYPKTEELWLDKEYQLLALKKMMACDNAAPFLLTGPFGTGKTRVLATAAINFLNNPANCVLICTSHLQSADAYIDKYFGPMVKYNEMPKHIKPVRLIGNDYVYRGDYPYLVKKIAKENEIIQSSLIITTSLTAPQLIKLTVKRFTHILIDEGAQTREPETIAPLGLADDNTKIVIAGDHLQVRNCLEQLIKCN